MELEELTRLDHYGHTKLESLSEDQLREYSDLLKARREEVLEQIKRLGEGG